MSALILAVVSCFVIGLTNAHYGGSPSSSLDEDLKVQRSQDLPVFATCQPSSNGASDIYWSMPDGQRVKANLESNVYSSHENEQLLLVIQKVNEESKGEYTCWEESDGETTRRKRFVLRSRASMPTFKSGYDFITAYEGDNITMVCEANGDRPMEYSWLDQRDSVISDSAPGVEIHKTENGSELHISWVSSETGGVYTCAAGNHHGRNSKLFRVTIKKKIDSFPPSFNEIKQKVYGVESQPLTLWCQAKGTPTPVYTWFDKHDVVLDSNHSRVIDVNQLDYNSSSTFYGNSSRDIRVSRKYGFLIFRALNESDSGNYTCKAENSLGAAFKVFEILINTSTGDFPPFFNETEEQVHGIANQSLTLKCQAKGIPTPVYTWFDKRGTEMDKNYPRVIDLDDMDYNSSETEDTLNSSRVIFVSKKEGSLTFTALNNLDSGNYTCKAENPLGTAFKHYEIYINTSVGDFTPFFNRSSENVTGLESKCLTLTCQAQGNPRPTYFWYNKYGERLDRFHPRVIEMDRPSDSWKLPIKNSSILVSNSKGEITFVQVHRGDAGAYTCYAENHLGKTSKTYWIYVSKRDDYVNVIAQNITDSSVTFHFLDSSADGFEVQYNLINNRDVSRIFWSLGEDYTVSNLLPGAIYTFQFRSRSGGNWTDPIRVALKPPPPDVILHNVESQKVKIEMFRPFYMLSYNTIDQYIIKYRTISKVGGNTWSYSTCEITIIIPSCYGSSYEISNLQTRAYYSITIQAVGPAGNSTLSEIKVYVPS